MKYLFVSRTGACLSLAMRVANEGHAAVLTSDSRIGQGIIQQFDLDNIRTIVSSVTPDVIVFDDPQYGSIADSLRTKGYRTALTSNWSKVLKSSTEYNQNVLRSFGFTLPTGKDEGYKLTVEGWFNGNKFVACLAGAVYDKFLAGNAGPTVSYMGSVIHGKFSTKDKLYRETLGKIEVPLKRVDYRGPVSIDVLVSKDKVIALEIFAHPRLATTHAFFEGTKTSVSDILFSMVSGEQLPAICIDDWIVSVGLTLPPWPYPITGKGYDPVVLTGINKQNSKHLWLVDAALTEDGNYICNRTSGFIGCVTARGKTIREAKRRVYRTIEHLAIPDLQYRNDIGQGAEGCFVELMAWGWLSEVSCR